MQHNLSWGANSRHCS